MSRRQAGHASGGGRRLHRERFRAGGWAKQLASGVLTMSGSVEVIAVDRIHPLSCCRKRLPEGTIWARS